MAYCFAAAKNFDEPPTVDLQLMLDTADQFTISRRDPDRARAVRGAERVSLEAGVVYTVSDYEAPFATPVVYQVISTGNVVLAQSDPVDLTPPIIDYAVAGTKALTAVWLRHLTIPRRSMPIDLANIDTPTLAQTRTVEAVIGRRDPVVLTDARRKSPTSTVDIRTWTLEERARLLTLLEDNSTLLLTVPADVGWGFTSSYITVGDVTEERLWQEWAPFAGRVFHLPVEYVDAPVGGSMDIGCTYRSLQEQAVCYVDFDGLFASYALLGSCGSGITPPVDPGDTTVDDVTQTNNLGQFGDVVTTTTPGTNAPDQQGSTVFNHQSLPYIVCSSTAYFNAGQNYTIIGETFYLTMDGGGTIRQTVTAIPGSSPATGGGTVLDSHTKTIDSGGYGNLYYEGNGPGGYPVFTPGYSGTYTITCYLSGTGTFSSAQASGYTRWLMSFSATTPGTTTTTFVPADAFTIRSYPTLQLGKTYSINTQQVLDTGDEPAHVTLMAASGAPSDTDMRANGNVLSSLPVGANSSTTASPGVDGFTVPQTGQYEFALRVTSDGIISDGTDSSNPRFIRVVETG